MKNKCALIIIFLLMGACTHAQQSITERLGYDKDAKLLILHTDDLALSHSEDSASIHLLEKQHASSGSIQVPCPWFSEMVQYAVAHPDADLGLHLTLTSEWKYYKWMPVAGKDKVPGLVNSKGYFYDDLDSLGKMAKTGEVEAELRAQIERAIQAGINVTHLDAHMGCAFFKKDFLEIYLRLAREYQLPCLLNINAFKLLYGIDITGMLTAKDVVTDNVFMAFPPNANAERGAYYAQMLNQLPPGLNCILIHAAFDDAEMKAITIEHPDYGAAWRQADFDFFNSDDFKYLLDKNNIHLITWREIRDKLTRQ